jgi:uncharacterized protein involved in outer membrane biogenesis
VAIALLLALPLAALAVAALVIDPNDYKREIAAAVEQATGRALVLNGPLRVSVSLWPTIEVEDVRLANLPGGSRPDMARVERIEAQLSLPSLLWRQVEFISLSLTGPRRPVSGPTRPPQPRPAASRCGSGLCTCRTG